MKSLKNYSVGIGKKVVGDFLPPYFFPIDPPLFSDMDFFEIFQILVQQYANQHQISKNSVLDCNHHKPYYLTSYLLDIIQFVTGTMRNLIRALNTPHFIREVAIGDFAPACCISEILVNTQVLYLHHKNQFNFADCSQLYHP